MLTLIRLQILQAMRIPITFFWTVGLPTLLFFVFNYNTNQICFLLSYIVFSSYAYGAALPILAARESGFLKSFIQNSNSFWRYVICIYCSITVIMCLSIVLFLVILKLSSGIDLFYSLLPILLLSLPAFFITLMGHDLKHLIVISINPLTNNFIMKFDRAREPKGLPC